MKSKIVMVSLLLSKGLIFAIQDIEEDLFELMRDVFLQKLSVNAPAERVNMENNAAKPKKIVDYKELFDHFEEYEHCDNCDEFIIDKSALMQRASEELALFDEMENAQFSSLAWCGGAAFISLVALCVPGLPTPPGIDLNSTLKATISGLGGLGFAILGCIIGSKLHDYVHQDQSLKKRHVAIRNWLNRVK